MTKRLLIFGTALLLGANAFATKVIITNSPGDVYSQPFVQINLGDTIEFVTTMNHTTREISFSSWITNDTTQLPGGYDGVPGGGIWVPTTLGDHYYICIEHADVAMKGIVKVSQLGVEDNKSVTLQVMQSVAEQYLKLIVNGGASGTMNIEMLNLSGQVVQTISMDLTGGETSTTIQVGDMPKGVYMIRWSYANINKAKKIILQ